MIPRTAAESITCAEQLVLVVLLDGLVISYAIWERWGDSHHYWVGQKTLYPLELDRQYEVDRRVITKV